jgi:hypothetical protein
LTAIDFRFATVTVTLAEPLTVPEVAVMLAVPGAIPLTTPALLTVATDESDEVQLADESVAVLPSLYVPVATRFCVEPVFIVKAWGVTVMAVKIGSMKNPLHPASSNATMAKATHSRLDRPRLAIPTTSEKQSYQTCIQPQEAQIVSILR